MTIGVLSRCFSVLKHQGPQWVCTRGLQTLKRRSGWFRATLPCGSWEEAPGYRALHRFEVIPAINEAATLGSDIAKSRAERVLAGTLPWYSQQEYEIGFPPDWSSSPWGKDTSNARLQHWSTISAFGSLDIKAVWEQSRFSFVFSLMRAYAYERESCIAEAFWRAVEDWRDKNPPQCGPQWMCGQEIALRAMALVCGFFVFSEDAATTPRRTAQLAEVLDVSGRRIKANIGYALGQCNNHGMSEAAGLFTLGLVLDRRSWISSGGRLLNELAEQLIYRDGSFSQHSTNYHRLMLHVYLWAIRLGEVAGEPLARQTIERVRRAGIWLRSLMSVETGRVPNLGGNDGAHFLDLTDLDYLDYRPTVQAVGLITEQRRWLEAGPWDELSAWLGADREGRSNRKQHADRDAGDQHRRVDSESKVSSENAFEFSAGGYYVWRDTGSVALLRCPRRFQHRPAQCDLLHFDLWLRGRNLLRDAGSYSYNCPEPWFSYFASAAAHNTIQFDGRDPMPKLARFLYGAWPRVHVRPEGLRVTAAYSDHHGVFHSRTIQRTESGFQISDEISGDFQQAVLRWRLDPEESWTLADCGCESPQMKLEVNLLPERAGSECELTEGWESLYYQQRTALPVLEFTVDRNCRRLVTEVTLRETSQHLERSVL